MNNNKYLLVGKALTIIFTLLFSIVMTGYIILMENAAAVTSYLGDTMQVLVDDGDKNEDTQYYKSAFDSVREVRESGENFVYEVMSEGAVLLKNDDNALPLAKGSDVSLFSSTSTNLVYVGSGSSSGNASSCSTLKEAFSAEDVSLNINEDLWNFYESTQSTYGRTFNTSVGVIYEIRDAGWDDLPDSKNDEADAAIFVLGRSGGEGRDVSKGSMGSTTAGDMTNDNYLELSPREITVLKALKAQKDAGAIDKIIILMNFANQVEADFIFDDAYGIDAALWCGMLGATGAEAVADILVGNVNPSGHLPDTFWKEHRFNPVYANYGSFTYTSGSSYPYTVYQEGIYNGYRYTETRYEDVVTDRPNTGEFDYDEAVAWPFGYGQSYTTFAYSDMSVTFNADDTYTVSVKVTNTGGMAGKDAVQLYLQKPYTDYDVEHGVEKAAVELVAYEKSDLLEPNESQTVELTVDKQDFASYDSNYAKTYIVDAGDYYFAVGADAHDAVNNILAKKGKTVGDGMTAAGDASMVCVVEDVAFDDETYSVSSKAMENDIADEVKPITNQFDNADINHYEGAGGQKVTYITRNNWAGTTLYGYDENMNSLGNEVKIYATDQIVKDISEADHVPQADDIAYPTYGSAKTNYSLIDLRLGADGEPLPYDDPLWDDLLDQLTWKEQALLLSVGFRMTYSISSINKPATIDHNGAVGVSQIFSNNTSTNRGLAITTNDPDKNTYPAIYPSNGIAAATFNHDLMVRYGEQWGEDGLWAGYAGLYGPGINTHRSAYGGRAFEYYSEDPYLGGMSCADMCRGIQSKGVYVYLKHAVLNDQEWNRILISTFANEQTIREVYLKQFQIAIEDGGAKNVMTGYNRIGAIWTGHQGFCNTVLRDEFGMTGFVVTDCIQTYEYTRMPGAILNGNDLPDKDYTMNSPYDAYRTGYGEFAWAMRESVHRILFTVVQSCAMNGISSSTKVVTLTPSWQILLNGFVAGAAILLGGSVLFLVSGFVFRKVDEESAAPTGKKKGGKR